MNKILKLVTYKKNIDLNCIDKVTNIPMGFNKPKGGLWSSPIDSKFGWSDWCLSEEYEFDPSTGFQFSIPINDRILIIDEVTDLEKLEWIKYYPTDRIYPDFEKACCAYDAIWLTEKGQWSTRLTNPYSLYGWDCECVLILNPSCIIL